MKNVGIIIVACVAAVGFGVWTLNHNPGQSVRSVGSDRLYDVVYVYDGDTVKLDNGERVRLIGIDAPEAHENDKLTRDVSHRHIDRETQLAMGKKSARYATDLLKAKQVRLEFDVEQRDKYSRLLAYVYLLDGTFINEKIIRDGYAYPLTIPPNVRHAHEFKQWFEEAREQKKGVVAMKQLLVLLGLVMVVGCASNEAVYRNYKELVNVGDGVDEQEAKIIAQKNILSTPEERDYRLTAPDIKTTVEAEKYPEYWFVVFGHNWLSPISTDPMAKTYTELKEAQYLVVINKKNGDIKFKGQWYPKRADNFDWIFDPERFRIEHSLGLFPGEPS